jgi:hypothetical protein
MSDQTQLILSLAPYIVPIIVALCVAFGKSLVAKLPTNVRDEAHLIVQHVVLSMEQTGQNMSGPAKKQAALALIESLLKNLHISIPASLIDVFIESAVASMNEGRDTTPVAPVGFTPHAVS